MSVAAPLCGIIVRDNVFSSRDRWERSRAHAENRSETKHVSFWGDFPGNNMTAENSCNYYEFIRIGHVSRQKMQRSV